MGTLRDASEARPRERNLLKRMLDARWNWNLFLGPIYNRLILDAASEVYQHLLDRVPPASNARVLDVGCGPGFVTLRLASVDPTVSVVGIDYSPAQIRTANRLRMRAGIDNCSFRVADAMRLPFASASFETVVSMASLKHWPDPGRGLREIRRVLAPEGAAFIAEADRAAPDPEVCRFAAGFRAWYVWDRFMRWYARRVVFGQSLSRAQAESAARAAGFRDVTADKVPGWPFFLLRLSD